MASSLGPITMMLNTTGLGCLTLKIVDREIKAVNKKIGELLARSQEKIAKLSCSFKETNIIQIMSNYDTKCSSVALESNLVESGLCAPIVHEKGSFCHGRSNIVNKETPIIYLSHEQSELDKVLLDTLSNKYSSLYQFDTKDLKEENYFWREYYLLLQMYYLSKKIAEDKEMDLTKPKIDKETIQALYNFKGQV